MFKESDTLELKRELNPKICKEIIALANTKGGTIYIGYDDDGNLVGLPNAKEELDKLSNYISDNIAPNLTFNLSLSIIKELEKEVIVIKVLKGTNRPYYLKSKGITPEGVYVRLGATNRMATRDEIVKMIMEDTNVKFEDNISINQDLTFKALEREFKNQDIELNNIKMKNMGLINDDNKYTNLAYIVSDQNNFPIKIAIYKGDDKVEFLDRKEIEEGSIFEQLEEVERFLKLVIKVPAKIVGMERVERPEYSLETIRESLLNSIIHRDYSVYGSTLINIYENSIEISNIGGLVGGLTIDSIKRGNSATRNPKLASIFHRLGLVEAYGSGIPRILARYKNQKKQVEIESVDNSFFIRFPKLEYNDDNDDSVIDYVKENGKITRENVQDILNCSKSSAIRKLNSYVDKSILKKIDGGKSTYYEKF